MWEHLINIHVWQIQSEAASTTDFTLMYVLYVLKIMSIKYYYTIPVYFN